MKTKGSFPPLQGSETTTAFQAIEHQCYQILENCKRKPTCLQCSALLTLLIEVTLFTSCIGEDSSLSQSCPVEAGEQNGLSPVQERAGVVHAWLGATAEPGKLTGDGLAN